MCNDKENSKSCNCISEILKLINVLQSEVCPGDSCLESCTKAFFGPTASTDFNTRPFKLYMCNGSFVEMPISSKPNEETLSNLFRVEKVDNCCATLRVLTYDNLENKFIATNSFFTINTNCVCAIKCLGDTYVEGV